MGLAILIGLYQSCASHYEVWASGKMTKLLISTGHFKLIDVMES